MLENGLEKQIREIIEPAVIDKGLRLVCVQKNGETLQIMAENPDTQNIGVDECAALSREISALLDVEDPIKGAYRLEVGSPGIDRPLITAEDFERYAGAEAKIEIDPPHEGQKRFRGRLKGTEEKNVVLQTDTETYAFPLTVVKKAKLVLTDELIRKQIK